MSSSSSSSSHHHEDDESCVSSDDLAKHCQRRRGGNNGNNKSKSLKKSLRKLKKSKPNVVITTTKTSVASVITGRNEGECRRDNKSDNSNDDVNKNIDFIISSSNSNANGTEKKKFVSKKTEDVIPGDADAADADTDVDVDNSIGKTLNTNTDRKFYCSIASSNNNEKVLNEDKEEKGSPTMDEAKTGLGTSLNNASSEFVRNRHNPSKSSDNSNSKSVDTSTDAATFLPTTTKTTMQEENETSASNVKKEEKKELHDADADTETETETETEVTTKVNIDNGSTTKEEATENEDNSRNNMATIGFNKKQKIIYNKKRDDNVNSATTTAATTVSATATAAVREEEISKPSPASSTLLSLPTSRALSVSESVAPAPATITASASTTSSATAAKLSQKSIIEKTYRNNASASNNDLQRSSQFPFRLHNMLDDAERVGHAHIISWCPDGDSFKIHQPKQLINVLQKYFRQSKFKSFLRQLQGYDFKRITRGNDQGVVTHPMFLRGRRPVCSLMKRKRVIPRGEQQAQENQASSTTTTTITTTTSDGITATESSTKNNNAARNNKEISVTSTRNGQPSINHNKNAGPMMYGGSSQNNNDINNVPILSSTQHHQISQRQGQHQPPQYSMHRHHPVSTAHHQRHIHLHEGPIKNDMQSHQYQHQHQHQHQQPFSAVQKTTTSTNAPDSVFATMKHNITINPDPQDVLCVDVPNVQQFQGNRKLYSIAQKIASHFLSANESVKTMIVNEISSRIQKGGSRFLKLTQDGRNWMECNGEEISRKVTSCFEAKDPIPAHSKEDLVVGVPNNTIGTAATVGGENLKPYPSIPEKLNSDSNVSADSDIRKRVQDLPRDKDVVLRGGPMSEKEGNTYLITMIQANVGQQVDSFEMKRIKCRAILDRMNKRGSRFFLKLKETDSDDDLYCLSDTEAQDVIFTAFCAEEKKIQSLLVNNNAAAASMQQTLVGIDGSRQGLSTAALLESQLGSRMIQNDTALLNSIRANNNTGLLSSQVAQSAYLATRSLGGKRPLEGSDQLPTDVYEKRLRAETDERVKMLLETARQERNDSFGLTGCLPYTGQPTVVDNNITGNARVDKFLKEREDINLQAIRNHFAPSNIRELPTNNNNTQIFGNPKLGYNNNDCHYG